MSKYGKTKLDHALSYFCMAFEKIIEFSLIVGLPLGIIEQVCIYGETHADQIISLLLVLMLILSAFGIKEIRKMRAKEHER
mgnify:CR=1 FL=1